MTLTNASGVSISKYPLQFGRPFLDGAIADEPQVLINGVPATTQADVKNRYPDGSVEFAVVAVVIPTIPVSGSVTLTFQNQVAGNNTPLTQAQMLGLPYMFSARIMLTPASGGTAQVIDARTMLTNGDYKLWTSGPVAQTIMLADDTPTRKYDIGFGDGYHPFRPRFYATFWPQTHQVFVRVVGEDGNTTELEDLNYNLTLTGASAKVYSKSNVTQWAMSSWTKSFWLGGTPSPEVNIDNNLAYLESTRFTPNYDTSFTLDPASVANEYTVYWTDMVHDIYDGSWDGGGWTNAMGTAGGRPDIGPEPTWDAMWLYTGDWRMRQLALGMADLAAAWPVNLREGDPTRRLNRADPVPGPGQTGSGYGLPISITDRKTLGDAIGGEVQLLYYSYIAPSDRLDVVGPLNLDQPWVYDASHEPAPFFVPYILTGDPFYLEELENWASYDAMIGDGADTTDDDGRGPTGDEGGDSDQLRGDGWILRSRAEAAFAVPDNDPEKTYLTILTQEDIARWEGSLGVTGTVFDGTAEKVWAQETGDIETRAGAGPYNNQAPPMHNWESNGATAPIASNVYSGVYLPNAVGAWTSVWMQWFVQYSLGRANELGFAALPLSLQSGQYLIGMINTSGEPMLIANYETPVEQAGGGFLPNWPSVLATFVPSWITGVDWTGTSDQGDLPEAFASNDTPQGYDANAMAALAPLVDEGAPGAAQAWAWMTANVYTPVLDSGYSWTTDPSWAIVPRTDDNTLPPQPTTPQ
ncbi:MAG TPA: hypothetical protein VMF05_02885 [Stellaceae bacterium]|nr:hypothetical protein [Stellaceae bacterium]